MAYFSEDFITWLDAKADQLDRESGHLADQLLERIAAEGVFGIAVPEIYGGQGGSKTEIVAFLSELAKHSLTAAFISWGHRTFIENILASSNDFLKKSWLPALLTGKLAAGTALSNATKFLSHIEDLNVTIIEKEGRYYLKGRLPWITNLRSDNFAAVFAAQFEDSSKEPIILVIPSGVSGLSRSADLEFVALQGSNTAALTFDNVLLDDAWILSKNAKRFLAQTRPEFLGYQFGLAFGLAERSLAEVAQSLSSNRSVLKEEYDETRAKLNIVQHDLFKGLESQEFIQEPRRLFQLRIDIVNIVAASLLLELQASGGRGYFKNSASGFIRRWNEGAFLPIVSPSAVQLRHILETI
ncbi:acyl-CoA dehydrogenase family protein [Streptococcus orisasini]|uniref:acyl-CoA dehydrogenase family protein n=1 Tax=Streptococcus orisasini TaxID=1080071 RepID=UPI00070B8C52|nr:acyl-CoA dehydrogenase family protein [Streptococcus orisasini]